jgi:hypothetical protein
LIFLTKQPLLIPETATGMAGESARAKVGGEVPGWLEIVAICSHYSKIFLDKRIGIV